MPGDAIDAVDCLVKEDGELVCEAQAVTHQGLLVMQIVP